MGRLRATGTGRAHRMGFTAASDPSRAWATVVQKFWEFKVPSGWGNAFPFLCYVADRCSSPQCLPFGVMWLPQPWWEGSPELSLICHRERKVHQSEQMQPQHRLKTPQDEFLRIGLRKTVKNLHLGLWHRQESWQVEKQPRDGNLFNQHVCLHLSPLYLL